MKKAKKKSKKPRSSSQPPGAAELFLFPALFTGGTAKSAASVLPILTVSAVLSGPGDLFFTRRMLRC